MNSAIRARREAEDGFTLIELLVVVIIIGILAAIAIPAFLNQRERAWQSELTSTVRNVALEIEAEATIFGGDYTQVVGAGAGGTFADFINAELASLQGATTTPVSLQSQAAAATDFSMCMEHAQLDPARVRYDSDAGGLQDYEESNC